MSMRIIQDNGEYEIPSDFELEFEETNPFFCEQGSRSMPVKLPYSEHNLKLLGRPERFARADKLRSEFAVSIYCGAIQKTGKQVVFSASEEGVATSIYLNEGEFYAKIKDAKLTELNYGGVRDPYAGAHEEKARRWLDYFTSVMTGQITDDFMVFPVCTKVDENKLEYDDGKYELLNEPDVTDDSLSYYPLLGYERRTIGDELCAVGYGVTPFLRLHCLLEYVFMNFGYELRPGIFASTLRSVVLLNRTADTVCAGKLDYRQIVPDMTVNEFLNVLRYKFGCEFIVKKDNIVEIMFMRDILDENRPADMDLTPFVVGTPFIEYGEFKRLKLTAGQSLDYAKPVNETAEKMFENYPYVIDVDENEFANQNALSTNQIVYRKAEGQFYRIDTAGAQIRIEKAGSGFFDRDSGGPLQAETKASPDEQVPSVALKRLQNTDVQMIIPFVGGKIHMNTGVKQKDGSVKEEKAGGNFAMLCYGAGKAAGAAKWYFGTPLRYDDTGQIRTDISLEYGGQGGLFASFWREYDACLRHAFQTVRVETKMPEHEFLKFNILTPKLINGVPAIPVSIRYKLSSAGVEITEAEFKTLRLMQPYNLQQEQFIPDYEPSPYYWVRFDNYNEQFLSNDPRVWYNAYYIDTPPQAKNYPPPVQSQYLAGGEYHIELCKVQVVEYHEIDGETIRRNEFIRHVKFWLEPRMR